MPSWYLEPSDALGNSEADNADEIPKAFQNDCAVDGVDM